MSASSYSFSSRAACLVAVAGAFGLAACGGGGDDSGSGGSGQGTLKVSMTDAPACGFDHVFVTVNKVRVHTSANADPGGSGWVDINVSPARKIDLLSLTNGALSELGQTPLPAGNYQQVRLVLDANTGGGSGALANSVVPTGGSEKSLDTPSAVQSGIKINRSFTVAPGTLTDLVLDFDACKSVVTRGNGSYGLKPVVTAIPTVVSGAVTGVVGSAPGASVYAERNGVVVKATVADANGNFTLSPIEQSSTAGAVDVVVVPGAANGRATGIVRSVPVVAGASTAISTSGAPLSLPTSSYRRVSGTVTPASAEATLRALQLVSGGTFEIAATAAASDTGAYSFFATAPALPVAAPVIGTYQAALPIPLQPDNAAGGKYSVQATSSAGVVQTQPVDVNSADVIQNFGF
ncbi:DUF4382 domain-containing protein [Cupriavidus pinatubonensis]|uniref:DUF4382 domain-containing protein n=1 Tax=Cupriavidus pinatubonensis TaxID=248026 RepID=A0ABM8WKT4_9BURK|nr:DUF4382 domain-containing protein [Cupriavidus pinatubonensis]CAG9167990.1 hypothetical protein LMG23994_01269 [Cupriavidus pinatubonensis]